MKKIIYCLLIVSVFCRQTFAQEAQPPVTQPVPSHNPKLNQAVKDISKNDPKYQDPNYDRIGSNSTAETLPKGSFTFNDYQLGILQLSYGLTDKTELSITTTVPVFQASLMPQA